MHGAQIVRIAGDVRPEHHGIDDLSVRGAAVIVARQVGHGMGIQFASEPLRAAAEEGVVAIRSQFRGELQGSHPWIPYTRGDWETPPTRSTRLEMANLESSCSSLPFRHRRDGCFDADAPSLLLFGTGVRRAVAQGPRRGSLRLRETYVNRRRAERRRGAALRVAAIRVSFGREGGCMVTS